MGGATAVVASATVEYPPRLPEGSIAAHPVAVGTRGREAGVGVGGGRGRRHLGEVGAARALAALDAVAADADVVGGGGPVEVDPGAAGGGGREPGGRRRRRRVGGRRGGGGGDRRVGAEVARLSRWRESCSGSQWKASGRCRCRRWPVGVRHLGEVGAAGALAALDAVAADADVVGGGGPVEVDPGAARRRWPSSPVGAVGGVVSGAAVTMPVFMSAWIVCLGERPVIDADLVDQPLEVLAVGAVAADPERVVGGLDGATRRAGWRPGCR